MLSVLHMMAEHSFGTSRVSPADAPAERDLVLGPHPIVVIEEGEGGRPSVLGQCHGFSVCVSHAAIAAPVAGRVAVAAQGWDGSREPTVRPPCPTRWVALQFAPCLMPRSWKAN